jgi:hypothetical protein
VTPLALGQTVGLDQRCVLDVLADSPVGPTVRAKRANIEARRYPLSFKLSLAAKDMGQVSRSTPTMRARPSIPPRPSGDGWTSGGAWRGRPGLLGRRRHHPRAAGAGHERACWSVPALP